ncbi:hypothetical protein ACJMK2_034576 [Sinanodonta woodiana]|uniref:ShKT domain-containing protein n=1 Tax=Sinanodonta woodiana TaxID=1069815 RepID=A0ABD3WS23_SINWO
MQTLTALLWIASISYVRPKVATEYKDLIIKLHNDYRKQQGASNMNLLEWDDKLANEAETWVLRCAFEHNNTKDMEGRGENLAFHAKLANEELIMDSMKTWYDEINSYNYAGKACFASCHYTQIVWAKTRKVGCAINTCARLRNSGWSGTANFFACWYYPKGNDMSEYPYDKGAACSTCLKGQTCNDQLCAGEGQEECVDKEPAMCPNWSAMGQCTSNRPYMIKSCRLSCKFCQGQQKTEDCKDIWPTPGNCASWKSTCQSNKSFMMVNCKKTCGLC